MVEELKKELAGLSEKLARREKLISMLDSLNAEERELSAREEQLRRILSKENADVERLERTSAAAVFYSLLGRKDERLEKERREASAAKLKYDPVVLQLDDCRDRISSLGEELSSLDGCQARYDEVFRRLQEALRDDPRYASRACALETAIGENESQLREINEALSVGRDAMAQIALVERSLGSAESWGTFDVLGGGLVSNIAKHSNLDAAQEGAERLQLLLSRFQTELSDVHFNAQSLHIRVDGFLRFADYFFDGLIADLTVLSSIHDSQESVLQVKQQLSEALSHLNMLLSQCEEERLRLRSELEKLVKSAV